MGKQNTVTLRVEPDNQPNRSAKLEDVAEGMVALAIKLDAVVLCRFKGPASNFASDPMVIEIAERHEKEKWL